MALAREDCAAVILAGGHSRRMGRDKTRLVVAGQALLPRLCRMTEGFGQRLLSANDPTVGAGLSMEVVADVLADAGPLGGLCSALQAARKPWLLCLPCDLPWLTPQVVDFLLAGFDGGAEALVCRDGEGRVHPLCGIYSRALLPLAQKQLGQGEYRMYRFLEQTGWAAADTAGVFPPQVFYNLNTPRDVARAEALGLGPIAFAP